MAENITAGTGENVAQRLVEIDSTKCVACGLCVSICPARSIRQEGKKPPEFARDGRCIRCGHCVSICPTGALGHTEMQSENFKTIEPAWTPELIETFLRSKRSVRHFTDKPVAKETLEKLLEVAAQAHPHSGWSEQDPAAWVAALEAAVAALKALHPQFSGRVSDGDVLVPGIPVGITFSALSNI